MAAWHIYRAAPSDLRQTSESPSVPPTALLDHLHFSQPPHTASPVVMVYSISRSLPAPVPRAPPPHYQSYLTPLLHRRFAHACLVSLVFCYIQAFLITDKSSCGEPFLSAKAGCPSKLTYLLISLLGHLPHQLDRLEMHLVVFPIGNAGSDS